MTKTKRGLTKLGGKGAPGRARPHLTKQGRDRIFQTVVKSNELSKSKDNQDPLDPITGGSGTNGRVTPGVQTYLEELDERMAAIKAERGTPDLQYPKPPIYLDKKQHALWNVMCEEIGEHRSWLIPQHILVVWLRALHVMLRYVLKQGEVGDDVPPAELNRWLQPIATFALISDRFNLVPPKIRQLAMDLATKGVIARTHLEKVVKDVDDEESPDDWRTAATEE